MIRTRNSGRIGHSVENLSVFGQNEDRRTSERRFLTTTSLQGTTFSPEVGEGNPEEDVSPGGSTQVSNRENISRGGTNYFATI